MNLLISGKAVRNATGPNDKPGGSETLAPEYWDVSEFAGKPVVIQIVDNATGGWGHINVDQIVQTDRKPPQLLANAKREFRIEKRYLNLPIKNGAAKGEQNYGVTLDTSGAIPLAHVVEIGSPVCPHEGETDCNANDLKGFKFRTETGGQWITGFWM
jgi:hypothetical protein